MLIDSKYRLGIDAMDAQHARWIELIEGFRASAEGHLCDAEGIAAARQALLGLIEYTHHHFASEEALLHAKGYPGLDAHRRLHNKLSSDVVALLHELDAERKHVAPLKLNLLATVWLFEHIMHDDGDYAEFLLGTGKYAATA